MRATHGTAGQAWKCSSSGQEKTHAPVPRRKCLPGTAREFPPFPLVWPSGMLERQADFRGNLDQKPGWRSPATRWRLINTGGRQMPGRIHGKTSQTAQARNTAEAKRQLYSGSAVLLRCVRNMMTSWHVLENGEPGLYSQMQFVPFVVQKQDAGKCAEILP